MELEEIKKRLMITDSFHDDLLTALADDVKKYMVDAGVKQEKLSDCIGVIAKGVADLYNDGKLSTTFYERITQVSL